MSVDGGQGINRILSRIEEINNRIEMFLGPVRPPETSEASGDSFAATLERTMSGSGGTSGAPEELRPMINEAARRHGLSPALVEAVARRESAFNAEAVSPKGAQGLMQIMPGTQRILGVTDPFDPGQSLDGGARYLRMMMDRFGGDVRRGLAAYNAGPEAVERYGGIPPYAETQNYVRRIMADLGEAGEE